MKAIPIWYNYSYQEEFNKLRGLTPSHVSDEDIEETIDQDAWITHGKPVYFRRSDVQYFYVSNDGSRISIKFYKDESVMNVVYTPELFNELERIIEKD